MANRPKKRKKEPINVIILPIDDREAYVKSLGTAMIEISEKQFGEQVVALAMEQIKRELGR